MYETGKRQMSYEMLYMLSDLFNVSIDDLLGKQKNYFMVNESERVFIRKMRLLDIRGQETVLSVLDKEYSFSVDTDEKKLAK